MTTLTPSAIARLSNANLADEIGSLDAQIKLLTKQADALKAEAKSRGADRIEGKLFYLTINTAPRSDLDTAALKKEFGEDWYAARCKISERTTLLVKPQAAALATL